MQMEVLMVNRETVYTIYGGDTVQMDMTTKYLPQLGVEIDICIHKKPINYDLIHFFQYYPTGQHLVSYLKKQ